MSLQTAFPTPFIPDFCQGRAVFQILLISQIVALMIVLGAPPGAEQPLVRLVVVSLFLHWISLLSAAALCATRLRLARLPLSLNVTLTLAMLVIICLLISEAAYWVGAFMRWDPFGRPGWHGEFLLRNGLICLIVSILMLRYFWVLHAWRGQVHASAEARFAALQARIRPHFLFNSLNSVAALISIRPTEAEALLEDLAELFRVILREHAPISTVARELELGRTYLRIEELRLGDRLRQDWDIAPDLDDARMPLLSLQPLLENAIYHGIERLEGGGCLTVRIWRMAGNLHVRVCNPVPDGEGIHGSRLAQDNIRQRLRLLYDDRASLETVCERGEYRVELRVPT